MLSWGMHVPPSMTQAAPRQHPKKRILLLGATGTIGSAVAKALVERGHEVVTIVRPGRNGLALPTGTHIREADVLDASTFARDGIKGERFDALVSCLASRTGAPKDAWAIDHDAHVIALDAAKEAGIPHFVLLSAICVQKPLLEFQKAKLAFEAKLAASGLTYTIVRPTAFFKSLSGQVERVKAGKPFLVFGDGTLTACKPLSDEDLASFIADCLEDATKQNRILPIGGPGPAITPRDQADALARILGRPVPVKRVPVAMLDVIIATLSLAGRIIPPLAAKAELAKIGRYYATESMLVLDPATGRYDAAATPATGRDTLFGFYEKLSRGEARIDRGDHAVF